MMGTRPKISLARSQEVVKAPPPDFVALQLAKTAANSSSTLFFADRMGVERDPFRRPEKRLCEGTRLLLVARVGFLAIAATEVAIASDIVDAISTIVQEEG